MGNTDRIRQRLAEAKAGVKPTPLPADRPPAPPPKPGQGKGKFKKGKKKPKGANVRPPLPPAVRENDKRLAGKPRLPAGVIQLQVWDGEKWKMAAFAFRPVEHAVRLFATVTRALEETNTFAPGGTVGKADHDAPKLFGGLHELDDKFREQLKLAESKKE